MRNHFVQHLRTQSQELQDHQVHNAYLESSITGSIAEKHIFL